MDLQFVCVWNIMWKSVLFHSCSLVYRTTNLPCQRIFPWSTTSSSWGTDQIQLGSWDQKVCMNYVSYNWSPQGKNKKCPFLQNFGYWPCPPGERIKFSVNERYNGKTRVVLNNQRLKYRNPVKNRKSLNFNFSIFSIG